MAGVIRTLGVADGVGVGALSSLAGVKSLSGASPSYTIDDGDGFDVFMNDASSGSATLTLPSAAANAGRWFTVINNVARTITIAGTISGGTNRKLTQQYAMIRIFCDGTYFHSMGAAGEWQENAKQSSSINATSNTYFSIDSGNSTFNDGSEVGVALGAGEHDVSGSAYFDIGAGDSVTEVILFFGTATGTGTSGIDTARGYAVHGLTYTTAGDASASFPPTRINITSAATYYLKARVTHSGGNVSYRGSIRARLFR
jgi:hypothetical protein